MNLDGKKLAAFNLLFEGFEGFIPTPSKIIVKSVEIYYRKSSFCTLVDLNHGFDGPWDIFLKFLN